MHPLSKIPLRSWRPLAASVLSLAVTGCDGCHRSKPYTPYTLPSAAPALASSSPPSAAAAPAAPPPADAGAPTADAGPAFPPIQGQKPAGDGKTWAIEGSGEVSAPVGRTFGVGLPMDIDGDGKRDLIAWAHGPDGLRGEILLARGDKPGETRTIAALPDGLSAPGCGARADLTQVGPHTVVFDFEPICTGHARDKAIRWVAVLRLPAAEIGMELRFAAPAEGESYQIAVDPRDRDGDGHDDVTATVTLSGAPRPFPGGVSTSATLAYFDRSAGLSRDPSEPEASLKALSSALVADARRKTSAPRVAAAALSLRRLYGLLCEEAGKPAITTSASPIRCGEAHVLEDAGMAEVEAALNLGEPIAGMAALARLEALGVHRKDVEALLSKNIPKVTATAVQKTTASPQIDPSPAFSPLAFDQSGDLLVHTKDQVIRVDHAAFGEAPVDAALRWPVKLAAKGDAPAWTLSSIEQRCDEPTFIGHFEIAGASGPSSLDLPLPIPTPPRCTPAPRVTAELLGTSSQGALVAVGADVVAIPAGDVPKPALPEALGTATGTAVELGAARSPDGATVAIPTARGLLVANLKGSGRGATAKLWTGIDAGAAYLCVPSNGGARVACVTTPNATIFEAK